MQIERYIGIMTGTSLDGIDLALVTFHIDPAAAVPDLLGMQHLTLPYPPAIVQSLEHLLTSPANVQTFADLHIAYTYAIADACKQFCEQEDIDLLTVTAVGFHGQTVWHDPYPHQFAGYSIRTTFQLGSGSTLANLLHLPVISDFRSADVALGGQGAPLVALFDAAYFRDAHYPVVMLNIGGIANVTILPPASLPPVYIRAFDTGPGNVLINAAAQHFFQQPYDADGQLAAQGTVHPEFLHALQQHPFFMQPPPKSTGRETFHWGWVENLLQEFPDIAPHDVLATLTYLTAWSIADHIQRFAPETAQQLFISGGGLHNTTLMEYLRQLLPNYHLFSTADKGIDPDAKEAVCFAYLAYRTWHHLSGNLPPVTGALLPTILGTIALPPEFAKTP